MATLVAEACCMVSSNISISQYYCAFVSNDIVFKRVSVMIVKKLSVSEIADSKIIRMFLIVWGN